MYPAESVSLGLMDLLVCWRRIGLLSAVLFAAACCVLSATATSYFVSNSGSDENPGTNLAVPFRTLERAALALEPGDTCFIRGGIYRETLMPQRSGTSNAPITYAAYPGEGVTLTG